MARRRETEWKERGGEREGEETWESPQERKKKDHGSAEEEGVYAIQETAVSWDDVARVFDTKPSLDKGFSEIADLAREAEAKREKEDLAEGEGGEEEHLERENGDKGHEESTKGAGPCLPRAQFGAELLFSEEATEGICSSVSEKGREKEKKQEVAAVYWIHMWDEIDEAGQKTYIEKTGKRRGQRSERR